MSDLLFPQLQFGEDPTERIRCPVHGFIRYSKRERQIIDHWVFQRLRNIRQLALCYYVYPGAMHSRFEHSLGVMEMTSRAFDTLALKFKELLLEELQQVPEFKADTLKRARQTLRLLALLHDSGHAAFSHAAESVLPGGCKHEDISVHVMEKVLGKELDSLFFLGMASLLVRIMKRSPELIFLRQFVVGEMDMDRTDYLWRDSLHCGVEYGKFDFRRLIESLAVLKHPDTGRLQIAIEKGGEHVFEALLIGRFQMNTQVYYHRTRRIFDHYLTQYMKLWGKDNYKAVDDVLKYDDLKLLVQMDADSKTTNERAEFAKRIVTRRHHKVVYETGDSADFIKLGKIKRIFESLKKEFKGIDFFLDDARGSIHKLTTPGSQEEREGFYLVNKNGEMRLITEESAILEKIPHEFRSVRIYADGNSATLSQISKRSREIAKGL
jgi:HD superfamily phosphohydrolase